MSCHERRSGATRPTSMMAGPNGDAKESQRINGAMGWTSRFDFLSHSVLILLPGAMGRCGNASLR